MSTFSLKDVKIQAKKERKIEVGKYINEEGKEVEVLFVGNKRVFTRNQIGTEDSWKINAFLEVHKPKPEEPKPIGRLVVNSAGQLIVRDNHIYYTDTVVTVNKQGILIEVKEC